MSNVRKPFPQFLVAFRSVDRQEVYTVAEAAKVLGITDRRVLQLVDGGELEAQREGSRWKVFRRSVHALRDSRRASSTPSEAPEWPSEAREALARVEALQRELGRLEGRLELTERTESTMREERERLLADLERERERADRLEGRAEQLRSELEAERNRGFWARLFRGG
jgi:excisionase family DNA binding protein